MLYQCINCESIWGDEPVEDGLMSHGLCKDCFLIKATPTIRTNQLKEGNFDCFKRSSGYCDQPCKYRELCL